MEDRLGDDESIYTPFEGPVELDPEAARRAAMASASNATFAGVHEDMSPLGPLPTTPPNRSASAGARSAEKAAARPPSLLTPEAAPNPPKQPLERTSTQSKMLLKRSSDGSSSDENHNDSRDRLTKHHEGLNDAAKRFDQGGFPSTIQPTTRKPLEENGMRSARDFDIFHDTALNGHDDEEDEDDMVSVDSYGIPRYVLRYPANTGRVGKPPKFEHTSDELSVPWYMRKPGGHPFQCTFFDFLRDPHFWKLFEFATRITAIAVLVPSALIAAKLPHSPFVSPFMVISATILAAKMNVGEAIAYLFVWIRAGCLWLPLSVIAGAIGLGNHIAGWCVYYTAVLFLMAVFTEAMPRRICLLLFNSCLVGLLTNPARGAVYPCRVMGDWCIGTGLCLIAAFFPYPIFCKKEAQRLLSDISKNTATAFRGLVYSFWSRNNIERNMAMSKVRIMTESLDGLLPAFEHSQTFSFYEFFFESPEVRELRQLKFHFFERLRVNLSSMTRVLDMVEATPNAIDNSDRSQAFGQLLMPHLNNVAEAFDELMDLLVAAKTKKAILSLDEHFDNLRRHTEELQEAYRLARRMLFYEHASDTLEEFVPLMTFYLFTVVCFRDTIDIYEMKVKAFKANAKTTLRDILKKTAWNPFHENVVFVRTLLELRNRREIQRVIEAAKVSAAMILTIGFSYLIGVESNSFSGPNIIAFVSGMNPVEAVQASIVRLTGCLIGTVLGFFAGTFSETPVQRVASLCTLMFVGTFLRTDKEYGIMSVYAMFVLVPLDSIVATTMEDTVSRMNQNTFGIFIYLFVSILVLPLSPSLILRAKRVNVLKRMSAFLSNMMWLFSIPTVSEMGNRSFSFKNAKEFAGYAPAHRASHVGADGEQDSDNLELMNNREGLAGKVSNRSMHMVLRADAPMEELNAQLDDIIKRLKGTKEFMGFAKDERGLVTIDYPVKACQATYLHMYHMTFLLKTMWLGWNVIRSQRRYTKETKHMLRSLQPIARDVAAAFSKITELMTYMMHDPSVNLEGELMKAELDLISACTDLHTRKSQIMLVLINASVAEFREDAASLRYREGVSPANSDPLDADGKPITNGGALGDEEVFTDAQQPQGSQPLSSAVARGRRRPEGAASEVTFSDRPLPAYQEPRSSPTSRSGPGRLPRAATFDGVTMDYPGSNNANGTPAASPNSQRSPQYTNFRVVASEKNVSVMPFLHRTAKSPTDYSEGPVRLPADFQFPVTSEDAEGLHSLTLCLEMFANETKLLMMSLAVMLDHLRSKL